MHGVAKEVLVGANILPTHRKLNNCAQESHQESSVIAKVVIIQVQNPPKKHLHTPNVLNNTPQIIEHSFASKIVLS